MLALLMTCLTVHTAPPSTVPLPAEVRKAAAQALDRGTGFLAATQRDDGSWTLNNAPDPALTALAIKCLIRHPHYGASHAAVRRGLDAIRRTARSDGGIHPEGSGLRNYYTSVCLMALAAADDPADRDIINRAQAFLKNLQWDETESIDARNSWYGGAGYGKHKRPDLSNTQMMLEALRQSGLPPEDPAYQKALKFIERCQMLSASNDQPFARAADDGGFIYTPVGEGESKAGVEITEGRQRLRTYGSMTYAGFKSYLYADLAHEDPRVQAAFEWIRAHYTLEHNPNMPQQQSAEGLYYYYQVFAEALQVWGESVIVDAAGKPHIWRAELCNQLIKRQRPDGSWVNEADRWYEGNPYLVTAYAVLALQTALE